MTLMDQLSRNNPAYFYGPGGISNHDAGYIRMLERSTVLSMKVVLYSSVM